MPTFKVWNAARDIRKTVQADSVAELLERGGQKLGLRGTLRIVLEADGSEIEDDSVLLEPRGVCSRLDVVLILLQSDEHWNTKSAKPTPKDSPYKSASGADHLLSIISQHSAQLRNFIDPDFGLLEELLSRGLLTEESYANIQKGDTYFKKNDYLIRYMKTKTKEGELQDFLDALRKTDQRHVVHYLMANGEHLEMCCGQERPLGVEENNQLSANGPYLLDNVIVNEELLAYLLSSECITLRHHEHIKVQSTPTKRVVELMTILRWRSIAAFQKFIDALHGTNHTDVADVLSQRGVAVPVHVNVTSDRPTRDLKVIEENLATRLTEFARTLFEGPGDMAKNRKLFEQIKNLFLEMELNKIRYLSSNRGKSIVVYLWCRSRSSMSHLCKMRNSGCLEFLLERTLELLVDDDDDDGKLSFSLKVIDHEWNLAERFFQDSERLTEFTKLSPFTELPKELLEIILMKSLLSFYNSTWRLFPFTDFNPYRAMTSVCRSWQELIANRQWFKSTIKLHLAKYKIIQGNSVLDILPKELVEMILMRSLLSAVHIPWQNSPSMPYETIRIMTSVCQQWRNLLSGRSWFSSTLRSYMKCNKHIATLQAHPSIFHQCLDVDVYFLYEMHSHGLLSEEQLLAIGSESDRIEQIKRLYTGVFLKFDSENYAKFLKVLQSTGQSHIAGYLAAKGVINPSQNDERPLSEDEKSRIDFVKPRFTDFIPLDEFLRALASCDCITKNQVNVINSLPDNLKMSELLAVVSRRSYAALRQFAAHLRKIDQYASIAEILTAEVAAAKNEALEQMKTSQLVFEKSSQEHDLKAIERSFAEKLLKVARSIESGGTITIQDLNEIRSFWLLLETCMVPTTSSELVFSDDCLTTGKFGKLKKSQSYTCIRHSYQELYLFLLKAVTGFGSSTVPREQTEKKSHSTKTVDTETKRNEMKGTGGLKFQLDATAMKLFQDFINFLSPKNVILF